jgi:hypothetical protein
LDSFGAAVCSIPIEKSSGMLGCVVYVVSINTMKTVGLIGFHVRFVLNFGRNVSLNQSFHSMRFMYFITLSCGLACICEWIALPLRGAEIGALIQADQAKNNINHIPPDLAIPILEDAGATAGKRVRMTTAGWETTYVFHTLYLPTDWIQGKKYPVLVEYTGNGGYRNALGDECSGSVVDCKLGYGLTKGQGFIWIGMPCVSLEEGVPSNAIKWWGDIDATKRYCLSTLAKVYEDFGGDSDRVILCGFSRGAIGCNVIGMHDDEIAKVWKGFFCHSHYDGVREKAWYPLGERQEAIDRLKRLDGRPQWISHEGSVEPTKTYLQSQTSAGAFTFEVLPFPNHCDGWVLRDIPLRAKARAWLNQVALGAHVDAKP